MDKDSSSDSDPINEREGEKGMRKFVACLRDRGLEARGSNESIGLANPKVDEWAKFMGLIFLI